ncbi:hypothetical protein PR003_g837 [Phytophthora rubi]|uniref:RxLR effector protein n=1 Tax=Phytophthora rubi TaxID=129364 RepID=A0A6A3P9H9_9STRA|nr:hypothetical protein PR002_g664 [Phytophthora rubi]KAE9052273.1 hypothetical protein PR001_g665 [Phytophthora rubi]KAE9359287.1 hypothetical protein PR003_g837 [Phytophthora rubi]
MLQSPIMFLVGLLLHPVHAEGERGGFRSTTTGRSLCALLRSACSTPCWGWSIC